jgi:hypothetical protein
VAQTTCLGHGVLQHQERGFGRQDNARPAEPRLGRRDRVISVG